MKRTKNKYLTFKQDITQELDEFISKYFVFAFSKAQYEEALHRLSLTNEAFQATYTGFMGGAIPINKVAEFKKISNKAKIKMYDKMISDYDFAKEAFKYEMTNFEVYYSGRYVEVLRSLCLTENDLKTNEKLSEAFKIARKEYWTWANENC